MFGQIRIDRQQVDQKVEAGRHWLFRLFKWLLVVGLVFGAGVVYGTLNATGSAEASSRGNGCPTGPEGAILYEETSAIMYGEAVSREILCAWVGGVVSESPLP